MQAAGETGWNPAAGPYLDGREIVGQRIGVVSEFLLTVRAIASLASASTSPVDGLRALYALEHVWSLEVHLQGL